MLGLGLRLSLCVLTATAACGGSTSGSPTTTGGTSGASSNGAGATAGANTAGGAAAAGMTATSGAGAADSAGAAGTTDDRLLPLEVGRSWTYTRSLVDPSTPSTECVMPLTATVPSKVMLPSEPKVGWDYHASCLTTMSAYVFIDGDDIRAYTSQTPFQLISNYAKPPVQAGFSWTGPITYSWRDEGTVSVPAGTFDRCWARVDGDAGDDYIVLCRGVGMVRNHSKTSNFMLELANKNF